MKYLIINADDFGYSRIFNAKILELIKNDLISSTSVMVNWINDEQADQVKELSELTKSHNISIGLHLEFFGENFKSETERQYRKFLSVFGFRPSHIDLHRLTYLKEAYPMIMEFCKEQRLPCRNHKIGGVDVVKTQNEVLSGTGKGVDELRSLIKNFEDGESYEILFHPGAYDTNCKSSLNKEREVDAKNIEEINPFLKENSIILISYNDLVSM